ncbi:MAG: hypothetical protein EOO63_04665 [Hymenobacter sp.]|nr:MAG: hypothetical protein EOO63_04665 [Hymenobacter sp.]
MLPYLKSLFLLLWLLPGSQLVAQATPRVAIVLQANPATHTFTCRYTITVPATDTASVLRLNLLRQWHLQSPGVPAQVSHVYYPYFGDTVQQVTVRHQAHQAKQLTISYSGTLDKNFATEHVLEFSGHTIWLPFRPNGEYELVDYTLAVQVPAGYQVRSTTPARRQRAGYYEFAGQASAIEPTALVARQFYELTTRTKPAIAVRKVSGPLLPADSALLPKAQDIIGFYNRTLGRQDPIARFTILLPGTDRDAFGLLDNATVITYPDFDVAQRGAELTLAHEISHKWWGYGSVHDESDWLNEAFATYSSMLYLQAKGDTAGYRQNYNKLAPTTANTPPIIGFDRTKYEPGMYRRVVYNKGMVVLAALHRRVGTAQLYTILATTAAHKVSTTTAFLDVVGQVAGAETRTWLRAQLSQ